MKKILRAVLAACIAAVIGCSSGDAPEEKGGAPDRGEAERHMIIRQEHPAAEQAQLSGSALSTCSLVAVPVEQEFSLQLQRTYFHRSKSGRQMLCGSRVVREIQFEAFQYGFSPSTLRVNRGERVRLVATSRDIDHGIYIREYGINAPVRKGECAKIEFTADKPGEFIIQCSVYCGRGFSHMRSRLIVDE